MYTQKHYENLADIIQQRRQAIIQANSSLSNVQLNVLNDLVMSLVTTFKADNSKFRELLFIARCNRDLIATAN
jgi:hypothetical protein